MRVLDQQPLDEVDGIIGDELVLAIKEVTLA